MAALVDAGPVNSVTRVLIEEYAYLFEVRSHGFNFSFLDCFVACYYVTAFRSFSFTYVHHCRARRKTMIPHHWRVCVARSSIWVQRQTTLPHRSNRYADWTDSNKNTARRRRLPLSRLRQNRRQQSRRQKQVTPQSPQRHTDSVTVRSSRAPSVHSMTTPHSTLLLFFHSFSLLLDDGW